MARTTQDATRNPHEHPEPPAGSTTVVFDDHRFCAGRRLEVAVMARAHRHSQFEINHLLTGTMTYWFDGRIISLSAGSTALFWGMVPHRSVAHAPDTRFVCLYIPAAFFVALPIGPGLRTALFSGQLVAAARRLETDDGMFRRWREDLLTDDQPLASIVRDELSARLRRIDRDGWRDLRQGADPALDPGLARAHGLAAGSDRLSAMARFIGEHSAEPIRAADVAAAGGLHPNYAMAMFKKAVGLTINDYITRNRLDTAQALLVASDDDIAGIAFASGFGSLSRFYEAFQARFGISPARFRRWHRGGEGR